jgi:hypothetical protein
MIDTFVQYNNDGLENNLRKSQNEGLKAVFQGPSQEFPFKSREELSTRIQERGQLLLSCYDISVFYGIYGAITKDLNQIKEICEAYHTYGSHKEVVGLSMNLNPEDSFGIANLSDQELIYKELVKQTYLGVIAISLGKESESELVSAQIIYASEAQFNGTLYFKDIFLQISLEAVNYAKKNLGLKIKTSTSPLKLDEKDNDGKYMLQTLMQGKIDWIEQDVAQSIESLKEKGIDKEVLQAIQYDNIINTFGLEGLIQK